MPMASSSNGSLLVMAKNNGPLFTSNDWGESWVGTYERRVRNVVQSRCIARWKTGRDGEYEGFIHVSDDGGATFTRRESAGSKRWTGVGCSDDGRKLLACAWQDVNWNTRYIYTSSDWGKTWEPHTNARSTSWTALALSEDGTHIVASNNEVAHNVGYIYTYSLRPTAAPTWQPEVITPQALPSSTTIGGKSFRSLHVILVAVAVGLLIIGCFVCVTCRPFGRTGTNTNTTTPPLVVAALYYGEDSSAAGSPDVRIYSPNGQVILQPSAPEKESMNNINAWRLHGCIAKSTVCATSQRLWQRTTAKEKAKKKRKRNVMSWGGGGKENCQPPLLTQDEASFLSAKARQSREFLPALFLYCFFFAVMVVSLCRFVCFGAWKGSQKGQARRAEVFGFRR